MLAPELTIWQRAHRRAASKSVPFAISVQAIVIPDVCPVLRIPISLGQARSENSPSLDRIVPEKGYVPGNVRVISDKANRLKGDRSLAQLKEKAVSGPSQFRDDYRLIANYVAREEFLSHVQSKGSELGLAGERWNTAIEFLNQVLGCEASIALSEVKQSEHFSEHEMTSAMIEDELGLTKKQTLLLRRLHGFPRPRRQRDGFRFVRADVEQWIATQPNPRDLASVLRRKPGTKIHRVRRVRSTLYSI